MKLSKAWCGLFTTVGAGVGLTAYLAHKGSELCQNTAATLINSFLDATINLSGLNTTITVQNFPSPLQVSLGNLSFNLRKALSKELTETLQSLPENLNTACKGFIWEQSAVILLACTGVAGLGIYTYKKFQEQERIRQTVAADDDWVYHSNFSINRASPS